MMEKRYYWLKFQKDFFTSKRIKKLRSLAGGDTFTIIYLKMQLKSLETEGVLEYTGLEKTFAEEIALDIDERPENVGVTINYLLSCGLMEEIDKSHLYLPFVAENTASEQASAERVREYRARAKEIVEAANPKALHCNTEIEKDIEIEKEKRKIFIPPSVDDVRAYCEERKNGIDPESFVAFYASKGWMVGKNKMKDWKSAVITWEKSRKRDSPNKPTTERKKQYDSFMEEQMNRLLNGDL